MIALWPFIGEDLSPCFIAGVVNFIAVLDSNLKLRTGRGIRLNPFLIIAFYFTLLVVLSHI